jgi:hypothetical protein
MKGAIYRYRQAGIALSQWEKLMLCLLKTLAALSVAWPAFALGLLVIKDNLTP